MEIKARIRNKPAIIRNLKSSSTVKSYSIKLQRGKKKMSTCPLEHNKVEQISLLGERFPPAVPPSQEILWEDVERRSEHSPFLSTCSESDRSPQSIKKRDRQSAWQKGKKEQKKKHTFEAKRKQTKKKDDNRVSGKQGIKLATRAQMAFKLALRSPEVRRKRIKNSFIMADTLLWKMAACSPLPIFLFSVI